MRTPPPRRPILFPLLALVAALLLVWWQKEPPALPSAKPPASSAGREIASGLRTGPSSTTRPPESAAAKLSDPAQPAVGEGASPAVRQLLEGLAAHPASLSVAQLKSWLAAPLETSVRLPWGRLEGVSATLDSLRTDDGVTALGFETQNPAGRFQLTYRGSGRLRAEWLIRGENVALAVDGPAGPDGWTLQPTPLENLLCLPAATRYGAKSSSLKNNNPPPPITPLPPGVAAAPPLLNSLPTASYVIYCDFDGEVSTHPKWNGGATIYAVAHPNANDATFVGNVWKRVSEDFAPFAINVTTDRAVFDATPTTRRVHCIVTPTDTAADGAGGVAYIGSFGDGTPCWAFNQDEYGCADTISHEVGHTLGLNHDGRTTNGDEYYGGHGSGATSWAPIMGAAWSDEGSSYYEYVTQWSKGEYSGANRTEDDLAIISGTGNGFGYRADDKGNTLATASLLKFSGGAVSDSGLIERTTDVDWLSFTTSGGSVTLNVGVLNVNSSNAPQPGANLAVAIDLINSSGTVLQSANPTTTLGASLSATLAAGTYYLRVDGAARGTASTGFTDYASLGQYFITGTVPVSGGNTLAVSASSSSPPAAGGNYQFDVLSNTTWSWTKNATWITTAEATSQSGNQTFSFAVAANTSSSSRTATITFTAGALTATHTVTQAGAVIDDHGNGTGSATVVSQNSTTNGSIETAGDEDFFRVNVTGPGILVAQTTGSTDTYGYLLNSAGTILTENDDDGDGTNFLISQTVAAGTYYVRVRHYDSSSTGSYQLGLTFSSTATLSLTPTSASVGATGGTFSFNVSSNAAWTWTDNASWLTSSEPSSQSGNQLFEYTVAANTSASARTATVTVTAGSLTATHTVTQAGTVTDDHGNTLATATGVAVPSATNGNIESAGDRDYFRLTLAAAGTLTVASAGSTDTYGTLMDSTGSSLASDDDSGDSTNFSIARVVTAGTYYVEVRHYSSSGTGAYQFTTQFTATPPDDHGDSTATATPVWPTSSTAGLIGIAGDNDYFRVDIPSAGTLTATTSGSLDTYGYLLASNGSTVVSDDDSGVGTNFSFTQTVSAGTYYVRVHAFSSADTGGYTLILSYTPNSPNFTLSTSTVGFPSNGGSSTVNITSNLGWSWVSSAAWLTAPTEASPQFGSQTFTFATSANAGASRSATITFSPDGRTAVTLTVNQAAGDDHGDTLATATVIAPSSNTAGAINFGGDNDYFRVTLSTRGRLTVLTTGSTDTYGHLLNSAGTQIVENDDFEALNFRLQQVLDAGTYYIRVRHYNSADGTGNYQLVSTFLPPPQIISQPAGTSLAAGEAHTMTVGASGSELTYQWYAGAAGNTGTPVVGAVGDRLTVNPTVTGSYWAMVSNGAGSVNSAAATVTVSTASAGATWSSMTSGTTAQLWGVFWLGGRFIVVGDGGVLLTSPDGITWTARTSGTTQQLEGVAWNGAEYVAVGTGGAIVSSANGTTWTARSSGTTAELNSVAWHGGYFWAVGPAGTARRSADGRTWSGVTTNAPEIYSVHAIRGTLASAGPQTLATSTNGTSWTARLTVSGLFFDSVATNGNTWLAVASDGKPYLSSNSGTSWSAGSAIHTSWLRGVASDGSGYVAVGNTGFIATSPNGTAWTARSSGISTILHSVAWNGRSYVAVGEAGRILRSAGAWPGATASSYAQWAASWGLTGAAAEALADWDGDGVRNVDEFVGGSRPGDSTHVPFGQLSLDRVNRLAVFSCSYNPNAASLGVLMQSSGDMASWLTRSPNVWSDGSGFTQRLSISVDATAPAQFFRLSHGTPP